MSCEEISNKAAKTSARPVPPRVPAEYLDPAILCRTFPRFREQPLQPSQAEVAPGRKVCELQSSSASHFRPVRL